MKSTTLPACVAMVGAACFFALAAPIVAGVIGYEMTIPSRRTSRQRKVFVRPTLQRTEEGAVLALAGVY